MAINWGPNASVQPQPTPTGGTGGINWNQTQTPPPVQTSTQPDPNALVTGGTPFQNFVANVKQVPGQIGQALQGASDFITNNNLPGAQLGKAIGTSVSGLYQGIKQGSMTPIQQAAQENDANYGKVVGDTIQSVATPASMLIGGPAGTGIGAVASRIGVNAAVGAGLGGANALASGQDVVKGAEFGGATGGLLSAGNETVGALLNKLPTWFAKAALPKLRDTTIPYALENTPLGTTGKMLEHSQAAVDSYDAQINAILSHPQYAGEVGRGSQAITDALSQMPNAQLDEGKVASILKQVAPANKSIVDKLQQGTATLAEKNALRQELDQATKKVFTDKPTLTFAKQIGHTVANGLRADVQTSAPETASIFKNFSKEIDLRNVLQAIDNKNNLKPTLSDIGAIITGYEGGGIKGALEAVAAERLLMSTGGRMAAAKGFQAAQKLAPVTNAAVRVGRTSIGQKAVQGLLQQ